MSDKAQFKNISILFLVTLITVFNPFSSSAYAINDRIRDVMGKDCSKPDDGDCYYADGVCDQNISPDQRGGCYSSDYNTQNQTCNVGDMYFNPFGNDISWELDNSHCLSYITTTAIGLAATFQACDFICVSAPTPAQNLQALVNQGLILEIFRIRNRELLDIIMKPSNNWKNKPLFLRTTVIKFCSIFIFSHPTYVIFPNFSTIEDDIGRLLNIFFTFEQ